MNLMCEMLAMVRVITYVRAAGISRGTLRTNQEETDVKRMLALPVPARSGMAGLRVVK